MTVDVEQTYRVLVTGWRFWDDVKLIHKVLNGIHQKALEEGKRMVLIHGNCPYGGADKIAEDWALARGIQVVRYTADVDAFGRLKGKERNAEMARDSRADYAVAFLHTKRSRGTMNCIKEINKNNIPLITYRYGGNTSV
jgi:hypothetical protein